MRKSLVNQQDMSKATKLREEGKTYQEIVDLVGNSVTLSWCKRNLVGVYIEAVDMSEANAKDDILQLALRDEGVTYGECCQTLLNYGVCSMETSKEDDDNSLHSVYQKYKRSIKAKHKQALFRPMWLRADDAVNCNNDMLTLADELYCILQAKVDDFMQSRFADDYDNASIRRSVEFELCSLGVPYKMKEHITARCDRNTEIALKLRERCGEEAQTHLLNTASPDEDLSYLPY